MTSTAGCKPMNRLDPYLTWRTAPKRSRSSRRKKPSSENLNTVQYETTPKETLSLTASDTEKNSVDVLGSRFKDDLGHVPIKKRRLQAFSSYLHKSTPIPKRQRKVCRSENKSLTYEDDFSGIEILAAVACHDDIARQWLKQQDSVPLLAAKNVSFEYAEDKKIPSWDLNEPPCDEQSASVVEIAPSDDPKEIEPQKTKADISAVNNQTAPCECETPANEESEKNTVSQSHLTSNLEDDKLSKVPSFVHDGAEELLQKSSVDSTTTHSEANLPKAAAEDGENSESNIFEADEVREFYDSSQFEDGELRDYDNHRRFVEEIRNPNPRIVSFGGKCRISSKESLPKPREREENMLKKLSSKPGLWDAKRPIRYDGPPKLKLENERLPNATQRRTFSRNEYHNDFERHRIDNRRNFFFPRSRSPPFQEFRQRMSFPNRVPEYHDDVSPPRGRYNERKYVQRFPSVTSEGQLRNALKGTGSYDGGYRFESDRQYDYKRFGSARVGWRFDSVRESYKPSGKKIREVGSGSRGEDGRRYVKRYDDDFGVRFVGDSHERRNGVGRYDVGE